MPPARSPQAPQEGRGSSSSAETKQFQFDRHTDQRPSQKSEARTTDPNQKTSVSFRVFPCSSVANVSCIFRGPCFPQPNKLRSPPKNLPWRPPENEAVRGRLAPTNRSPLASAGISNHAHLGGASWPQVHAHLGGARWPRPSLVLENDAVLHHEGDLRHQADVGQRVALHGDEVGELAGFERSEAVVDSEQFRGF